MNQNENISQHVCQDKILICTYTDCKNEKRLLCSQCSNKHQHGKLDQQHLIKISNFWQYIFENIEPKTLAIKQLKQKLEQMNHNKILEIKNEVIVKLLNINNIDEAELFLIQDLLDLVIKSQVNSEYISDNKQTKYQNEQTQSCQNKEQTLKYDSIYYYKSNIPFRPVQPSPNEQYLVITYKCYKIHLLKLKTKKKLGLYCQKHSVQKLKFNDKSILLFSGDFQGNLQCLSLKARFKQIRKIKIHHQLFSDLKVIKNDKVITSCFIEKSIIIMDIKLNFILNRIQDPNFVYQIDYDYKNNIIVSLSGGKSIILINYQNQIVIEQQRPHKTALIQQLQLMDDCQNLLSSSWDQLKLWQIIYDRKCLIELMKFQNDGLIYNVQSVFENNNFMIITKTKVFITDDQFNPIYEKDHQIILINPQYVKHSNNINYILIIGENQLEILKKC